MFRILAALLLFGLSATAQTSPPAGGVRITLKRGSCGLGSCPAYSLAIEGDGAVVYEGKRSVSAVGTRKGQIKAAVVRDLAQKFRDIGYFDFARNYGSCED